MMRYLVIGRNGQLARSLQDIAATRALDLTCVSYICDNWNGLIAQHAPTAVINAAAYTAVDKAESEPDAAHSGNALLPQALARACATANIPLIHISTDYVFDGTKTTAYHPSDITAPQSVYGKTKAAGEEAVRKAHPWHAIIRTSWVFSAYGHNFLKTMLRLAATRDELAIVADQRGCPTPASSLAEAALATADALHRNPALSGTYHYAGAPFTTWHGFAATIFESAQAQGLKTPAVLKPQTTADYPTPAQRPANSVLETTQFTSVFGIPAADWRQALAPMIEKIMAEQQKQQTEAAA